MRDGDARTAFAQAIAWIREGRGVTFEFDDFPYDFTVCPIEGARWAVGNGYHTYRATLIEIGTCDGPKGLRFRVNTFKGPAGAEEPVDGHIILGANVVTVRPALDEPIATLPRLECIPESLEAVYSAMFELEYRICVALDDEGLRLTPEQQRALRGIKNRVSEFNWDGVGGPQHSEGGQ